jgi:hypothetical protein
VSSLLEVETLLLTSRQQPKWSVIPEHRASQCFESISTQLNETT